jgi:hypothetical protein
MVSIARDNPTWGQARIAAELRLKLGIQVSARTVQKYRLENPKAGRRQAVPSQRWMTFVGNHAKGWWPATARPSFRFRDYTSVWMAVPNACLVRYHRTPFVLLK